MIEFLGSSPLARGLRPDDPDASSTTRIIPARAGFTRRVCQVIWAVEDHPRSRGVYFAWKIPLISEFTDHPRSRGVYIIASTVDLELPGSSPLARGLRRYYRAGLRP